MHRDDDKRELEEASPPHQPPLNCCNRGVRADELYADLTRADFRCAQLANCTFPDGADLTEAKLSGANLCGADLSQAANLDWWQLGATNLRGAVLPRRLKLESVQTLRDLAVRAEKLLFGMLATCATTLILIVLTSHVQFFTPASAIDLPFLSVPVPIRAFYFLTPWLILLAYGYMLSTLLKLWETLRETPAILRRGRPIFEVVSSYPNFTAVPFGHLWPEHVRTATRSSGAPTNRRVTRWDRILVGTLVWFPVPLTELGFWLAFLPAHDRSGTFLQGIALVLSVAVTIVAYGHMIALLTREMPWLNRSWLFSAPRRKAAECAVTEPRFRHWWVVGVSGVLVITMGIVTYMGFYSVPFFRCDEHALSRYEESRGPCYLFAANLAHVKLTDLVLHNTNLRRAFLQHAHLERSDLDHSKLDGALLTEAQASGVILKDVSARYAIFWEAMLDGANLKEAQFAHADFRGASLRGARMQGDSLLNADLTGANLSGAILCGAVLMDSAGKHAATFSPAQLERAYGIELLVNWLAPTGSYDAWGAYDSIHGPRYLSPDERHEFERWRDAQVAGDSLLRWIGHRTELHTDTLITLVRRIDVSMGEGTQRLEDALVGRVGKHAQTIALEDVEKDLGAFLDRVRRKALNHCVPVREPNPVVAAWRSFAPTIKAPSPPFLDWVY